MVDVLERGDIFFVYRPRVQEDSAEGLEDVPQPKARQILPFDKL